MVHESTQWCTSCARDYGVVHECGVVHEYEWCLRWVHEYTVHLDSTFLGVHLDSTFLGVHLDSTFLSVLLDSTSLGVHLDSTSLGSQVTWATKMLRGR